MTATATRRPPARRRKWVMDVPATFGNVNLGDSTCRLGVAVDAAYLAVEAAAEALRGTRIKGRIVLGGAEDARGQGRLGLDDEIAIEGSFDSKSFTAPVKKITFGLTMNLQELGDQALILGKFAKHTGRFQVESVSSLAGQDDDEEEEEEEEEDDEE